MKRGDILIYGCNVAKGETGADFIGKLAQSTRADVAASDDFTGSSAKGGDWTLEYTDGTVNTQALTLQYDGLLALPTDGPYSFTGATDDDNDGTWITADGFFTISASDGFGTSDYVKADQYGAFINDMVNTTSLGTSYIEVAVAGGGSFSVSNAVIGEFAANGSPDSNNFTNVYAVGYANGSQVAITSAHDSVDVYETDYNFNFSSFKRCNN